MSAVTPADAPAARRFSPGPRVQAAALAGFCALLLWCYARHHQFPFFYHTDEPAKVAQVMTGTRNFHHPLLMITTTELAARLVCGTWTEQGIVVIGRWFSAVCAVLAVAGLAVLAARIGGPVAGAGTALLAGFHPLLFELSHYMKEDCGLLFGLIASLLSLDTFLRRRTAATAALTGAACGLAISAKYIGALILLAAVVAVIVAEVRAGSRHVVRRLAVLLGAGVLVFALINFEALTAPHRAVAGVGGEFSQMESLAKGNALIQTNYLRKIPRKISPPILAGALLYLGGFFTPVRRQRHLLEWTLAGFTLVYLLAIHFTPLAKDRYLLPVLMLMCFMAPLGWIEVFRWAKTRFHPRPGIVPAIAAGTAVLAFGWQLPLTFTYQREFGRDSRMELAAWIREHLPPDAIIAHDARVSLNRSDARIPNLTIPQQTVEARRFLPDLGSLDEMRHQGITHVVAARYVWGNLFQKQAHANPRRREQRLFYEKLFAHGDLLWETPPGRLLYIHPGLRLYALPDAAAD